MERKFLNKQEDSSPTCLIGIGLLEACPKNCKSVLKNNDSFINLQKTCLGTGKMNAFLEGKSTFNVGISAFYQTSPELLNNFIAERAENLELVSYYLSISESEKVTDIVEGLSDAVLFRLFEENYNNFLKLKKDYEKNQRIKNFFQIKSNRFWQGVGFDKICKLIVYAIRERHDFELASQFLVLLPTGVISGLQKFTDLTPEEEKNLYMGLGDSIYELPISNPSVYPHMMKLLEDEMEISLVLGTMEELVKRQEKILQITTNLIEYYEEHSFGLSIQHIYSELNGLEPELISEILGQLKERSVISESQKDMLNMVFQKGNINFLKTIREDILL